MPQQGARHVQGPEGKDRSGCRSQASLWGKARPCRDRTTARHWPRQCEGSI